MKFNRGKMMNPKAGNFKIKKCYICDYPLSDEHHIYPKRLGGIPLIRLCPNHHRLANILQKIILDGLMDGDTDGVVRENIKFFSFDQEFVKIIPDLVYEYEIEEIRARDRWEGNEYAVYEYRKRAIRLGSGIIEGCCYQYRARRPIVTIDA